MSRKGLSPGRLEAFSDGVIAVIITIMVLELKVPAPDGIAGLRAVLPTVFLYLLTFVQIGIYWVNHHYLVDEVETVSHGILWAKHFSRRRLHGAVVADTRAECGAPARNLGQADRVRLPVSPGNTRGLVPARCLSGAHRNRRVALAAAAQSGISNRKSCCRIADRNLFT